MFVDLGMLETVFDFLYICEKVRGKNEDGYVLFVILALAQTDGGKTPVL